MTGESMSFPDPAESGIPAAALLEFLDAVESRVDALHSFHLARYGRTVAEGWWHPYRSELPHMMFSVSKSFTATAVGLAAAEGRLSVDDPVLRFFPDAAPGAAGANLAAMRVRHLLTMTTGHAVDPSERFDHRPGGDWLRAFFEQPVEHQPGTRFVYNSGASYLLSAIVQRSTGATLLEYLRPRLFTPLGIPQPTWESCPQGINAGGWGLALRTAELARFGQLHLDRGVFDGVRLLPRQWVGAATGRQVDSGTPDGAADWDRGYGYQFWRNRPGGYRADGAFGQYCVVLPEQDAVLTTTGGTPDTQPLLDLVWTHLLPAMANTPAPADPDAHRALTERLAGLRLPAVAGASGLPPGVAGRHHVVARPGAPTSGAPGELPAITSIAFATTADGWQVTVEDSRGSHDLRFGAGHWQDGTTSYGHDGPVPVAGCGARVDDDVLLLRLCFPQTPFIRTFTCRFDASGVTVAARDNVSFGPTEHPPVRAEAVLPPAPGRVAPAG